MSKTYSNFAAGERLIEPVYVMSPADDLEIWAGSGQLMWEDPDGFDLTIALGEPGFDNDYLPISQGLVKAENGAQDLLPMASSITLRPSLTINWPDGRFPAHLTLEWWETFVGELAALPSRLGRPARVGVFCRGGKGRTGTALAIIAALSGECAGENPVLWVRRNYVREAVETFAQVAYIGEITGVDMTTLPVTTWATSWDPELKRNVWSKVTIPLVEMLQRREKLD